MRLPGLFRSSASIGRPSNEFLSGSQVLQKRHCYMTIPRVLSVRRLANQAGCGDFRSSCSIRARDAVQLLPSYLSDARSIVKYSDLHPKGALQLSVAESKMLEDWLVPALLTPLNNSHVSDLIYYQPTAGREDCRGAVGKYVERLAGLSPGTLDLEGLTIGAGCNAVLENLCFCLAEHGDSILIPTPYYAAFEFDLAARAGLHVEPVKTQEYSSVGAPKDNASGYYPNTAALDAAFGRSELAGHNPKILLICHPHNPLGICYPPSVVAEILTWCRSRKIHLIADEIYAGSVYRGPSFSSVLKTARGQEGLGPYVHWVYSLSKDFGLSGMRVGIAYSENESIRLPMMKLNDFCQVSSTTQRWVAEWFQKPMPNRKLWPDAFLCAHRDRLSARSRKLTDCLDGLSIPYLPPTSGFFVWIDLSQFLPTDSMLTNEEKEHQLYLRLAHDFGLLLTPGTSMRSEKPGFFRCVFAAATDSEFIVCLEKFRVLASTFEVSC
jgi:aspartate/methionine/tyrosine aminotransferase